MNQMHLSNKAKLVNYVLHAKHMRFEKKVDKIKDLIEEFDEVVGSAEKEFFC